MLVVCVEAGLGLNQALLRVAEEIVHVSPLHERADRPGQPGDPRRHCRARRRSATSASGPALADIRSLVAMLIQTDRFGTSVATALRVHADTLRTKRRQRAEEAAAKTTIKLIFPLVFFIFPAMFVVILGPALIQIVRTLQGTVSTVQVRQRGPRCRARRRSRGGGRLVARGCAGCLAVRRSSRVRAC